MSDLEKDKFVAIGISMPIIDGIEVTKQIRAQCSQTRVLVLSGYSDSELVQRALQAGATGCVLKDFLAWDLVLAIRSLYQGKPYFSNQIAEIANACVNAQNGEIVSKDKAP
jgi:two-component system nitrate/nitrite response regulator NarL